MTNYQTYNKVKAILLFLTIFVVACNSGVKDNGCEQFRNGSFVFHLKGNAGPVDFLIDRKDSIQTEQNKSTGSLSRFSIIWTGNCTYELKLIESNADFPDSIQQMRKRISVKTEILTWTKEYYVLKATQEGANYVMVDTMWVGN